MRNFNSRMIKYIIGGFFLFFITLHSYGQYIVQGKVTDSLQEFLGYANIVAIPESDAVDMAFAITDNNGFYKLQLEKDQTYEITVSYLGYKPHKLTLTTTGQDITKDFVLYENPNQLDEVVLNYTPPVTVKKDTLIYKVDAFVTGEERKLREVLKKLPGVEVDRAGNVMVQGKRVTKVLVEDKTFFTGNSKLAVNNIPADAVYKVEVLDNYSEVAMLKGLQDSEEMAMNIKLKEDKKQFAFGDVEVGGGIKERYLLHPNLFYYSPKTNVNFIGDLNNTGVKSFTFSDYLEFEGGFGKLLGDVGSYFNLYNSDFSRFLNNQDFTSNENIFGALNIRQSLTSFTDLSGYVITSNSNTETRNSTINEYLTTDEPFIEERTTTNSFKNNFVLGKLTLNHDPSYEEDLALHSFIKLTKNDGKGNILTINPDQDNSIATLNQINALNFKQNLSYSRKLSKAHTATVEATYTFQEDSPDTNWITDQQILQGLIPLEDDTIYDIMQTKRVRTHNVNAIVKDYWVLNNFNHLYTSFGTNLAFNRFFSRDEQLLTDGSINDFSNAGFGNDFGYDFTNLFMGLEYKFMIGIATFKPALYYHYYHWTTQQFNDKQANSKTLLLPQFTSKIEFSNSEKINLRYSLNARFPTIDRLASRFILSGFNSVFRGNATLENQLYHSASLSYYKFSLFRNLNINANVSFNKKIKHFKNVTQLQGIDQFSTPVLFDQPEHNVSLSGFISKKINKIRYKFKSRFSYNDFFQIVNAQTNLNVSKTVSNTISAESFFENFPNLEIGYTKDFSDYRSLGNTTRFENDVFFVNLEYDFFKDFILKADYSFDQYTNNSLDIKNTFDNANASIFYQKEDSPWGFEVSATNIFNVKFKQQNYFSDFLISDSKTFIMPRIIMFKVIYKL